MFLDILEFVVENKNKKKLGKTVLKMWSQLCQKKADVSTKLLLEKNATIKKKLKTKKT